MTWIAAAIPVFPEHASVTVTSDKVQHLLEMLEAVSLASANPRKTLRSLAGKLSFVAGLVPQAVAAQGHASNDDPRASPELAGCSGRKRGLPSTLPKLHSEDPYRVEASVATPPLPPLGKRWQS